LGGFGLGLFGSGYKAMMGIYEPSSRNASCCVHIEKKGQMLDTYERFHIYEISKQNLQLNDNYAEIYNTIISTY
jgi:hypothetical protein